MQKNPASVYLVGAGPGDPKLLTLRGKELIERADVIFYDYLANPELLSWAKPNAECIYVGKKGGGRQAEHQQTINDNMVAAAKAGQCVVRLKGGDPFVFGRAGEELEALVENKIPFEIVPGVSSAIGAPTYAGIPLTHRKLSSSLTIVTGQEDPEKEGRHNWKHLAQGAETLVFLMAMGNLKGIVQKLIQHGRPAETPAALIEWGTHAKQRTVGGRLDNITEVAQQEQIKPPVVFVIGDVVSRRSEFNWFERRPLFGKQIVVTRAKAQAGEFIPMLTELGAQTISFPTLNIVPPPSWEPLDQALRQIEHYDKLIFTSVNGLRFFRDRLRTLKIDLRELKGLSVSAIGPRTAKEIENWDITVDLIPTEYKAEALIEALGQGGLKGQKILIPRALIAREILPEQLRERGATVDVVPAYQALRPNYTDEELDARFDQKSIDMLTFASASTLRNFIEIIGQERFQRYFKQSKIACIGPITALAAEAAKLNVDVMPEAYTFPALTEAILDYYAEKA